MSERFYTNCPLEPGFIELAGAEAHHLAAVCRFRPGDQICLFNGDGREYPSQVRAVERRKVVLEVIRQEAPGRELAFRLEVAAPLPKGDRAQFLIEKLTELGVSAFVPLRTQRSVVEPREAKLEKLRRYVIEASKQCGRNVLMQIESPAEWAGYCREERTGELRFVAHPEQDACSKINLPAGSAGSVRIAVGPEGGFTDDEVSLAKDASWRIINMGPRIFRVETAAIVLTSWIVL